MSFHPTSGHAAVRPRRARSRLGFLALVFLALGLAPAEAQPSSTPVLDAMAAELDRSFELLRSEETPPYFLSYEITEAHTVVLGASFGELSQDYDKRSRLLDIDLRVGNPTLDNTHPRRGGGRFGRPFDSYSFSPVPLDDDPLALRRELWRETDRRYKRAVENLTAVRTNVQVKAEETDDSPDFVAAEPVELVEEPRALDLAGPQAAAWKDKVERFSRPFATQAAVYRAEATLTARAEVRWYVNTEGSRLRTSRVGYRLSLSALTKADDGMELPRYESFFAYSLDDLPGDQAVLATVEDMVADLETLRLAPVVEPYTGPAVLSGRAAGVFFHEVLGHRVEGHRQKSEDEGQTFKSKVGEALLPPTFSVRFDPTRRRHNDIDLAGHYRFDNEGVEGEAVEVIENGVFRRFLMSRSPIEGEPRSNGHGRKQPGFRAVSRQSNLIVDVDERVSHQELKQELIRRVRAEGKPFGLFFEDIQGGFTLTGRRVPNAFNVLPILVYRVFPDGREELVRGVDLIGTPLTAFSAVSAADDRVEVFNGVCGAESGGVPVAAVSPGILISRVEVQKKEKSQERPPLLPAPLDKALPVAGVREAAGE